MRIGRTIPPAASPIYIRDIINGFKGLLRGGQEIERFRSELKEHYGVKHCFLISSGKAALTLILQSLHDIYPERDEVLIPAFCCFSVPSAIVRAGLKVKLCDVDPDTLDYDYDQLRELIAQSSKLKETEGRKVGGYETKMVGSGAKHQIPTTNNPQQTTNNTHADRLLAIIPVHLFGLVADVERVRSLVADPSVSIIEDAAQVLGSSLDGKKLGTLGNVGFFSLGRGKALSTVEGGIIITSRDDIAEHIAAQYSKLKDYSLIELVKLIVKAVILIFFQHPVFFWFPRLLPFLRVGDTIYDPEFKIRKLSTFQAGLARNWKEKLGKFQKHRQSVSGHWRSGLKLSSENCYFPKNGHVADLLRFPIRISDDELWKNILRESDKDGYGIMFTYPTSINGIGELKGIFQEQKYPAAEQLPYQLLTLPIHSYVTSKDKERIAMALSQIQKS